MASSCRITSGPTDPKHHRNSTVHSLTNPNLNLSEKHDDAIRNTESEPKLPMMGLGGYVTGDAERGKEEDGCLSQQKNCGIFDWQFNL